MVCMVEHSPPLCLMIGFYEHNTAQHTAEMYTESEKKGEVLRNGWRTSTATDSIPAATAHTTIHHIYHYTAIKNLKKQFVDGAIVCKFEIQKNEFILQPIPYHAMPSVHLERTAKRITGSFVIWRCGHISRWANKAASGVYMCTRWTTV